LRARAQEIEGLCEELERLKEENNVVGEESSRLREDKDKLLGENVIVQGENSRLQGENSKLLQENNRLGEDNTRLVEENTKLLQLERYPHPTTQQPHYHPTPLHPSRPPPPLTPFPTALSPTAPLIITYPLPAHHLNQTEPTDLLASSHLNIVVPGQEGAKVTAEDQDKRDADQWDGCQDQWGVQVVCLESRRYCSI
jgi:hypothetical protein